MTDQNQCFLERLHLENYRCFDDLVLDFHDRLTVLVAPNGGGKTAVLDAVAVVLRVFVNTLVGRSVPKDFGVRNVRRVLSPENTMEWVSPARLELQGRILGTQFLWSRKLTVDSSSQGMTGRETGLAALANRLSEANQEWILRKAPQAPLLPLIAYYGTGRLWGVAKLTESKRPRGRTPNARFRAYSGCLSSSSHYKTFIDWFRRFSYEAKQATTDDRPSPHRPQVPLAVVRRAVDIGLKPSGWHSLEWDFAEDTIVAHHAVHGRLPCRASQRRDPQHDRAGRRHRSPHSAAE